MTKISQEHEFTFTQPGLCKIKQKFWLYNQKHFNSLQISAINLKKKKSCTNYRSLQSFRCWTNTNYWSLKIFLCCLEVKALMLSSRNKTTSVPMEVHVSLFVSTSPWVPHSCHCEDVFTIKWLNSWPLSYTMNMRHIMHCTTNITKKSRL